MLYILACSMLQRHPCFTCKSVKCSRTIHPCFTWRW